MAFNKNFDDETGYAASRDLPVIVAQYMQATGKSEEEVAKEILKAQEESKPVKGIVTPEDNGWTDLKKLGLWIKENANADEERNARAREAIAKSWNDYRDRTDPWFRTGLVNAIFGDSSMLNGYYNAMNSNAEAEKNRELQEKINTAMNKSSGNSIEDALNKKENQKWLDEQGYPALDEAFASMEEQANSTGTFTPGDITPSTVAKFVNTAKAIKKKGGDVSKYEHLLNIDEDGNIVSFNYDALKADPNKPKGTKEVKAERDAFLAGIKQRIQNMNVFLKNNPKEKPKYNEMYKSIQDEIQSEMDNGATDIDMSWLGARSKDKPPKTAMEIYKDYAKSVKKLYKNTDKQREAMRIKFPNASDRDITEALK